MNEHKKLTYVRWAQLVLGWVAMFGFNTWCCHLS